MSKLSAKKSVVQSKVNEDYCSSSGHDDEKLGNVSKSLRNGEQSAMPCIDIKLSPDANDTHAKLKRLYNEEDEDVEYGSEMNNMLKMFGSTMSKASHAKKKRLENFTIGIMKANQKMVVEPWENQLNNSMGIAKEMFKLSTSILDQADNDVAQMKDQDEKMIKIFQQQMKANAQCRNVTLQRLASCRQINETCVKGAQEQDEKHRGELTNLQYDLKKELSSLQKKMLIDSQKEEMENVKKNLNKMYFMSNN